MYNLLNLDALEFEKFSRDFIEKKLNKKFKRFGVGKDGGIDLISLDEKIICQCKRYKDSTGLKVVCEDECEKLKKYSFEEYYFITTAELNKTVTDSIYNIFKPWMRDYSHIIGATDICDFLDDENNIDILKKNHKLWLTSANVLSICLNRYVDNVSKITLDEIEEISKYFVDTKPYYNAIKAIENTNIVLLTGEPGVGKTLTSKMLIRYLLANNNNYKLRTVLHGNLPQLISSLQTCDEPEIIFLDDFLGQTCLSIDDSLISELKVILKLSKKYKNKKVILNSRITILNKAKFEKIEFSNLLSELKLTECLVNINDISNLDRARILYNLMYHNGVYCEHYEEIKKDKRYNIIIGHKSFNTRIIEWCIKNFNTVDSDKFYDFLLDSLNNPKNVWKSEFERIEACDVILMHQLFTLGDTYIPIEILKIATMNSLYTRGFSTEIYSFDDSINRLSKSLISTTFLNKKKYVNVLTPSINDYIQNFLKDNQAELQKIFNESLYIEQVTKICSISMFPLSLGIANFDNLKAYVSYSHFNTTDDHELKKKIEFILKYNYCDKKITNFIKNIFENEFSGNYLIRLVLNQKIREFYQLNDIIFDIEKMSKILLNPDYLYLEELYEFYSDEEADLNLVETFMSDIFTDSVESYLIDYGGDIINSYIVESSSEEKFVFENNTFTISDDYISCITDWVKEEICKRYDDLSDMLKKQGYLLDEIAINFDYIIDYIAIEDELHEDLSSFLAELESDSMERDYSDINVDLSISVDDIFSQKYDI